MQVFVVQILADLLTNIFLLFIFLLVTSAAYAATAMMATTFPHGYERRLISYPIAISLALFGAFARSECGFTDWICYHPQFQPERLDHIVNISVFSFWRWLSESK